MAWDDKVKGRIEIANSELDDLVIFRSDGYATYNFAVVVDDIDMGITDVVRGDDHVNNTPRQINIYKALGVPVPHFAHLPMILDPEGAKLSKRTGAADVMQYRDAGYLPHALLNYLARLGWSHGDQEIFSIAQMQSLFDLQDVNAKAARLDLAKLGWFNQQYLKSDDAGGCRAPPGMAPARSRLRPRQGPGTGRHRAGAARPCADAEGNGRACRGVVRPAGRIRRGRRRQAPEARRTRAAGRCARAPGRRGRVVRRRGECGAARHRGRAGLGMGKVAQPLRVAITGTQVSPDIGHTVYLAGRDEALARIDAALAKVPDGA